MILITDYTEAKKEYIKSLNMEWLKKYASVEHNDLVQLSNPQNEIINKGGLIFYALFNKEIIGTVTLMRRSSTIYELSKMAVTETHKGMGIGSKLIEHCLNKVVELGAQKLILYSHTKLEPAIHLYRKFGFTEVPLGETIYKRANIKMEKVLALHSI